MNMKTEFDFLKLGKFEERPLKWRNLPFRLILPVEFFIQISFVTFQKPLLFKKVYFTVKLKLPVGMRNFFLPLKKLKLKTNEKPHDTTTVKSNTNDDYKHCRADEAWSF